MTVHAYNHSNIITMTIIIIITATKIGELLWCSYNNMTTTILILVGYTTFLPSKQILAISQSLWKGVDFSKKNQPMKSLIIWTNQEPRIIWTNQEPRNLSTNQKPRNIGKLGRHLWHVPFGFWHATCETLLMRIWQI